MRKNAKKLLSLALALCLALAMLPTAALAADTTIRIVPTDIQADRVMNTEGYGSLQTDSKGSVFDGTFKSNARTALIDKTGSFLFPYRDSYRRYRVSDGIISLTQTDAYSWTWGDDAVEDHVPCYYTLDGTPAFPWTDEVFSGPMTDGYCLMIEGGSLMEDGPQWAHIVDRTGNVTCTLPSEYTKLSSFGEGPTDAGGFDGGFSAEKTLGWCGEGLFASASVISEGGYDFTQELLGYIAPTGETVIDLMGKGYVNGWPFHEGLAAVEDRSGKIGFIGKTGTLVIPCIYDGVNSFSDGLCGVKKDGKWGYIDKTGKTVIPFVYDGSYGSGDGLAAVVKDGKCGLVDYNNQVVVPLEYDDISSYEDGVAYGIKDGRVYVMTGYEPGASDKPTAPAATAPADPTNDKLTINGAAATPAAYKIDGANYFKLRDLAALLNGTKCQFNVDWDDTARSVTMTTGQPYEKLDSDLQGKPTVSDTANLSGDVVYVNGTKAELTVYKVGSANYFKLRDLGTLLDFFVDYENGTMIIDTSRPYSE